MSSSEKWSAEFWSEIQRRVEEKVQEGLALSKAKRRPLIEYLQDLEVAARRQSQGRDTIQIIASGRSLLGDRSEVGPTGRRFTGHPEHVRSSPPG